MQQFCLFGILAGLQPALLIIIELSEKKVNVFRLSFLHDFYHKITFFSLKRTFLKVEKDYEKGSNRFIRLFRQCRIKIMWCCLSCTFIKGKLYAGRTQNDKNRSTVTQSDSGASGLIQNRREDSKLRCYRTVLMMRKRKGLVKVCTVLCSFFYFSTFFQKCQLFFSIFYDVYL